MTCASDIPTADDAPADPSWLVYVLMSTTLRRTYVGTTTDTARRVAQHNGELPGGARATRAGRPWRLAATYGPYPTRSEAQKVERQVKRLRGRARLRFSGGGAPA